jgi:hypothetical protein
MRTSITVEETKALRNAGIIKDEFLAFVFPVQVCIKDFGMSADEHKEALIELIRKDLLAVGNRSVAVDLIKI